MIGNPDADKLLARAVAGDADALGAILDQQKARLRLLVKCRLDPRLQGRVDPSDVIQEACLEAALRLPDYLRERAERNMPFFLWLRFLTSQRLLIVHRHHLGTKMRDARRQISLHPQGAAASSAALASQLVSGRTSPSQAAIRAEMQDRLHDALADMEDVDREVLSLRHFEQLTNAEAARVLDLTESATSHRYGTALRRLKEILRGLPGPPNEDVQ